MRPVTLFDVSRQRSKMAAEINLTDGLPPTRLSRRRNAAAQSRLAIAALGRAGSLDAIALGTPARPSARGSGHDQRRNVPRAGISAPGPAIRPFVSKARPRGWRIIWCSNRAINLSNALGIAANLTTISNACASGANAIGHAWQLVREGRAAKVLTGGYDALCHLTFAGFDSLQALSPSPCRPFDAGRDGLTLGEGAAVLALESLDSARGRGAEIIGEIIGYGASTDNHHLTQPHPEGNAALAAMNAACASAGLTPEQIDYVNAHGTATPQNDAAEAAAINAWAGPRAATLPVSSTKGWHRPLARRSGSGRSGYLPDGVARPVASPSSFAERARSRLPLSN